MSGILMSYIRMQYAIMFAFPSWTSAQVIEYITRGTPHGIFNIEIMITLEMVHVPKCKDVDCARS